MRPLDIARELLGSRPCAGAGVNTVARPEELREAPSSVRPLDQEIDPVSCGMQNTRVATRTLDTDVTDHQIHRTQYDAGLKDPRKRPRILKL